MIKGHKVGNNFYHNVHYDLLNGHNVLVIVLIVPSLFSLWLILPVGEHNEYYKGLHIVQDEQI